MVSSVVTEDGSNNKTDLGEFIVGSSHDGGTETPELSLPISAEVAWVPEKDDAAWVLTFGLSVDSSSDSKCDERVRPRVPAIDREYECHR